MKCLVLGAPSGYAGVTAKVCGPSPEQASPPRVTLLPGDTGQCPGTSVVVTWGQFLGSSGWSQGGCPSPHSAQDGAPQRMTRPPCRQCSGGETVPRPVVLRLFKVQGPLRWEHRAHLPAHFLCGIPAISERTCPVGIWQPGCRAGCRLEGSVTHQLPFPGIISE